MKSLERATKWCAFIINETNKNSNYTLHKQCLCRISRRMRNIHFEQPNNDVPLFFRQFHVIWAVQNQSFSESCHARGEACLRPGAHSPRSRVRVPAPTTPACAPTEGKGAREGQPPRAPRDRRGLCQAGLFRALNAPRDCPGLAPSRTRPSGRGPRGSRAPGAGRGQPPAEPRPPTPALPRSPQARAPPILQDGAPSLLPVPRSPLPGSRAGCERRRGSGTAARAAPTLPPESGVEHSASPRGANEEDVAATAPPTSGRGTAGRPASRHARPDTQREGPGSGSHRPQALHDALAGKGTEGKSISMESGLRVPQLGPSVETGTLEILRRSHDLLLWLVTLR